MTIALANCAMRKLVTGRVVPQPAAPKPLGPDQGSGAVKGMQSDLGMGAVKGTGSDLGMGAVKRRDGDSNVAAGAAMFEPFPVVNGESRISRPPAIAAPAALTGADPAARLGRDRIIDDTCSLSVSSLRPSRPGRQTHGDFS